MKFEPTKNRLKNMKCLSGTRMQNLEFLSIGDYFLCLHGQERKGKIWAELSEEGDGFANSMFYSPYAEWYLNTSRIEGSPTNIHHKETYGENFNYFDFQKEFEEKNQSMNAEE